MAKNDAAFVSRLALEKMHERLLRYRAYLEHPESDAAQKEWGPGYVHFLEKMAETHGLTLGKVMPFILETWEQCTEQVRQAYLQIEA